MIVRPAEPAHPGHNKFNESFRTIDLDTLPPEIADMLREARKIRATPSIYVAMLDDWVEHGADSRYALPPDEVVQRSQPRGDSRGTAAAAEFELGQYLHRARRTRGRDPPLARRPTGCIRRTGRTSARRGTSRIPIRQGHTDTYDSSWFEDLKKIGAENYYPEIIP